MNLTAVDVYALVGAAALGAVFFLLARRRQREGTFALVWGLLGLIAAVGYAGIVALFHLPDHPGVHDLLSRVLHTWPGLRLYAYGGLYGADVFSVLALWTGVVGLLIWRRRRTLRERKLGIAAVCLAVATGLAALTPYALSVDMYAGIVADARRDVERKPDDPAVRLTYARWLNLVGLPDMALREALHARAFGKDKTPDPALQVGIAYLSLGRPDAALEPLRAAYGERGHYKRFWAKRLHEITREANAVPPDIRWTFKDEIRAASAGAQDDIGNATEPYVSCLILLGRWEEARQVQTGLTREAPAPWTNWGIAADMDRALGDDAAFRALVEDARKRAPKIADWLAKLPGKEPAPEKLKRRLVWWARERERPRGSLPTRLILRALVR